MIQLLQGGAYLVGGTQIIEDTQEAALAIENKTGKKVTKEEAAKQTIAAIMMVLEDDEQIDDMTWYIGQNPQASEEELVAVAYQIVKEAHEK